MDAVERAACALEHPTGYALFAEEAHSMEVEIIGSEGLRVLDAPPDIGWDDPFERFRLTQTITLGPHEHLGRQQSRLGPPSATDPVVDVLSLLQQRAADFNRRQQKKPVTLDVIALQAEVLGAMRLQLDDARALAEAVPIGDEPREVQAWTTRLVIYLDPPDPGLIPGGESRAMVTHATSPSGEEEVHVEIVHRGPEEPPRKREAERPNNMLYRTQCDMHTIVAALLGHTFDDVSFSYPDDSS